MKHHTLPWQLISISPGHATRFLVEKDRNLYFSKEKISDNLIDQSPLLASVYILVDKCWEFCILPSSHINTLLLISKSIVISCLLDIVLVFQGGVTCWSLLQLRTMFKHWEKIKIKTPNCNRVTLHRAKLYSAWFLAWLGVTWKVVGSGDGNLYHLLVRSQILAMGGSCDTT